MQCSPPDSTGIAPARCWTPGSTRARCANARHSGASARSMRCRRSSSTTPISFPAASLPTYSSASCASSPSAGARPGSTPDPAVGYRDDGARGPSAAGGARLVGGRRGRRARGCFGAGGTGRALVRGARRARFVLAGPPGRRLGAGLGDESECLGTRALRGRHHLEDRFVLGLAVAVDVELGLRILAGRLLEALLELGRVDRLVVPEDLGLRI